MELRRNVPTARETFYNYGSTELLRRWRNLIS